MESLKPFQPLHLEMILNDEQEASDPQERTSLFLSVVLEKPIQSQIDQLSYAVVNWAQFNPIPSNVRKFAVAFVTESNLKFHVPYVKLFTKNAGSLA